jgi:hypothetical protein
MVSEKKTGRDVKVSDGNLNIALHNISYKLRQEGNVKCSALLQNAPQSEKGIEGRGQEQEGEGQQQQEQEGGGDDE